MKDWKEKIPTDPEQYSDWSCDRDDVINFIDQIISERDKEILKELEALREKHGGFAGVVLATLAHNLGMGDY